MKKIFQIVGVLSLFIFSFVFADNTARVVKEQDDIMIKIYEIKDNYYKEPIDAIVDDKTFIPGKYGASVDVDKSYYKMKKIGVFSDSLIEYKSIKPNAIMKENRDKYIIGGNKKEKKVALIFLFFKNTNLNILPIIDSIDSNIFVDGAFLEDNNSLINELSKKHIIGNLSYGLDYNNSSFIWLNTLIKEFNQGYCYTEDYNSDVLKICERNGNYTIKPSIVLKNNPLIKIKDNLVNGSIISIYLNNEMENELQTIINYIKTKGYDIVKLDELLNEQLY